MSRLGNEIMQARTRAGLSQKQLAKKLGVSEGFIADVEVGRRVLNNILLTRIKGVLGSIGAEMEEAVSLPTVASPVRKVVAPAKGEKPQTDEAVKDIWQDALGGVVKEVPVVDVSLNSLKETRKLLVMDNRVEGIAKDKVFYLRIPDNDMIGFRMVRDDLALCGMTRDYEEDGYYLILLNDKRVVRQLKKTAIGQLSIASHNGVLHRETVLLRDVQIVAKLYRIEIKL